MKDVALFSPPVFWALVTAWVFVAAFLWLYRKYKAESQKNQTLREELARKDEQSARALREADERLRGEIQKYQQALLDEQRRRRAAAEEREQRAGGLPDHFAQTIGYIHMQAQAARALLQKNDSQAAFENLRMLVQAAQEAQSELRGYILGLPDAAPAPRVFFESLRRYLEAFRRAWEIETVLSVPQDTMPLLSEIVEDQALQIVQEALANVHKHAEARRVEVLLTLQPRETLLVISDNGRGFTPARAPGAEQKRFGLSLMRERAEQIGGKLEVRSAPGQGTQIIVHIPRWISLLPQQAPEDLRKMRILLADDQPLFLEGMKNLLTSRGLTVVGVARDGYEAVEQARALRPALILMDAFMPNMSGIEAARVIKRDFPEIKVALLAVEDEETLLEAVKAGVSGCLAKTMDANDVISNLTNIMRGEMVVPPRLTARVLAAARPLSEEDMASALTARQWDILRLVAKGLTYKETAKMLNISEVTVKYHMGQIIERLGVKNREQAVAYALRVSGNVP